MEKNYPQQSGIKAIRLDAFNDWNRTISFQIMYSLLYFSLFFLGYFYLFRYFGLWDEFAQYQDLARTDFPAFNQKMQEIAQPVSYTHLDVYKRQSLIFLFFSKCCL